jgi:hypothetical protein
MAGQIPPRIPENDGSAVCALQTIKIWLDGRVASVWRRLKLFRTRDKWRKLSVVCNIVSVTV